MDESMDFAFFRGEIVEQRRRIHRRLRSNKAEWPLSAEDETELRAIDDLLHRIEDYSRDIQHALSAAN